MMKWRIDRRVTVVLSLVLLISIGVTSYRSLLLFSETTLKVQQAQSSIIRMERLIAQLRGAETGQRGYLLTGDDRYLQPYTAAITSIDLQLNKLQALHHNNPTQRRRLRRLKALVHAKLIELQHTIALRYHQGYEAALAVVQTHQGKNVMDRIQTLVQTMKKDAQQTVVERSQLAQTQAHQTALFLVLESVSIVCLLTIALLRLNRYHQAQQYLQTTIALFRHAILDAPLPIMLHAETGEVLQLNRAWTEMTGYNQNDIPTIADWAECTYEQRKEAIQANVDRLKRRERAESISIVKLRNGETRLWSLFSSPIQSPSLNQPIVNTTAIDLTESEFIQNALTFLQDEIENRVAERTTQLEQANASLEFFSRTVAHDLYAPLRTIQSFAQILLDDYTDTLEETEYHYLKRIQNAAQRMDVFIQDLLIYSRLDRADLQLQPINLATLVSSILIDLEELLQQAHAEVEVVEPLAIVMGHPLALTQVISNLLTNAIKFIEPGTQPHVRIFTEVLSGTRIRLAIQDNGIGIDATDQTRIFSIFERLYPAERFPGSGIGLAIVQKAVERMEGRVGVESRPGQGSCFWIELSAMTESIASSAGEQS